MAIYIVFATILFFGAFSKKRKVVYKAAMLFLFLLTALRNPTHGGSDSIVYYNLFNAIPKLQTYNSFKSDYGIGYPILNSLVKTLCNNYIVFQIVCAIITFLLLNYLISRLKLTDFEKCIFLFSYFCYRFMWNTWVTYRQNIANLLFWIALTFVWDAVSKKRKIVAGTLGTVGAWLFHSSGIANAAILPVVGLMSRISAKKKMIGITISSLGLWFFGEQLLSKLVIFATEYISNRYTMYMENDGGTSNPINFVFRLFFFIWFAYRFSRTDYQQKEMVLDTLAIMVLLGSINSELMLRMYEYYAVGLYTSLAVFFRSFSMKSKGIAAFIFYLGMMAILVRSVFVFGNGIFVEYQFFWQMM